MEASQGGGGETSGKPVIRQFRTSGSQYARYIRALQALDGKTSASMAATVAAWFLKAGSFMACLPPCSSRGGRKRLAGFVPQSLS